jgi:putative tryptophan/tyrosine transport system substrate-binding protein
MHEAFLQGLREFGYVEGQNLLLEHRYADGRLERFPTLAAEFREFAEAGGLMAYGQNLSDLFRRCGRQVGRILQGAKPADLAVERPMKFELVINLKTAKALGLTIPPLLLFQADDWKLDRRSRSLTTI